MVRQSVKIYSLDNAKISIYRHFSEKASPEDVVKKAVIECCQKPTFLTAYLEDAKILLDSNKPLRQFRRAGGQ